MRLIDQLMEARVAEAAARGEFDALCARVEGR